MGFFVKIEFDKLNPRANLIPATLRPIAPFVLEIACFVCNCTYLLVKVQQYSYMIISEQLEARPTMSYIILVLYLGVEADQIVKSGYSYYLTHLDTFLQDELGSDYVQTKGVKELITNGHGRSIQFTYKGKVQVDLKWIFL